MSGYIKKIRELGLAFAHRPYYTELSNVVLDNPKFAYWSASGKPFQHHYGREGLAKHTYELINLCFKVSAQYKDVHKINEEILFWGSLYHDYGKIWDYSNVTERSFEKAHHSRIVHHVSRSAIEFSIAARNLSAPLPPGYEEQIVHCILSHHGQREWGSPVMPRSREAWIIHLCDALSARIDDAHSDQLKN